MPPDVASKRHALITGLTGQDGSFLTELLLEHGENAEVLVFDLPGEG